MSVQSPTVKRAAPRTNWFVPAALILLTAVPVIAGSIRVTELAGGAEVTADNARFFAMPLPVLVHIVAATLFCVVGAFQFVPRFRSRRSGWHRAAGRVLAPAGLATALTGVWMALFYPNAEGDGTLLVVIRVVFGSAMFGAVVLGLAAIRRRDFARHRAWMIRGYALAQAAGSQAVIYLPWTVALGHPDEFSRALLLGSGWVINLAVAEWLIRRRPFSA